jgi:hypothetical protein
MKASYIIGLIENYLTEHGGSIRNHNFILLESDKFFKMDNEKIQTVLDDVSDYYKTVIMLEHKMARIGIKVLVCN